MERISSSSSARSGKTYRKSDLPIRLGRFENFGDLTVEPDELDKYGFTAFIPNTNLMDAGYDYGAMFMIKDALCEGTQWHTRKVPANPATDPYFPIGQANLSLALESGQADRHPQDDDTEFSAL
jgi:hypothetical protein